MPGRKPRLFQCQRKENHLQNHPLTVLFLWLPLCKLLERVVATRLRWFLESRNMLNQYQTGFRKGRGCVDHIDRLTQFIAASSKEQMTIGVFMDLEKAFDMVWREGIIDQLSVLGSKGTPLQWIHIYLQDRSIQMRIGSALSQSFVFENDTSQSSVLTFLLFIITMNAIPNPRKGVDLYMYADHIALWTILTSSRGMTTRITDQLNGTAKFLSANGFKISASKSQSVLFTNSRVKRSEANIRLQGIGKEIIPLSPAAIFLGIPGCKTKLVCSGRSCQNPLHQTLQCTYSHFGKLMGCKQIQPATSLQCHHPLSPWLRLRSDWPRMQTHQGLLQQDPVSSIEDLLW